MKCPNCGAEIGTNNVCDFCGSTISLEMKREGEQLKKNGCPKCGSTNIKFNRENHGEVKGKNSKQVVHRTVGFCQDCGHTWYPDSEANAEPQKKNTLWWVLGWIFFFPAPVMILIWRKKNKWDIKVKIAVTVVFWILILVIGSTNRSDSSSSTSNTKSTTTEQSEVQKSTTEAKIDTTTEVKSKASSESKTITESKASSESKIEDKSKTSKEDSILENATVGQKNAYKKALSYLSYTAFSHDGLIEQLEFEKFSTEDATWAADNCGADWFEQAVAKGENYLSYTSFSHDSLIEQLEYEKFTKEQATYAADILFETGSSGNSDNTGTKQDTFSSSGETVGQKNALQKAKDYLSFTAFSYTGLIEQLEYEGFTKEEATYGADNCGTDWKEQAVKKAADYLSFSSFSKSGLIEQLEYEGFTTEQATYGAEQNGF